MRINAINSYNNINFGKRQKANKQSSQQTHVEYHKKASKAPLYTAMGLMSLLGAGCEPIHIDVYAHARADVPEGIPVHDTIYVPGDTIVKHDTVYIPPEFEFPYEIEDSINIWRGDYLDVPVENDDKTYKNKALLKVSGRREWDYNKFESAALNLKKSNKEEAIYDHVIYGPDAQLDSIRNDIRVTLVKPGDLTAVLEDGTVTSDISGLLFNEDGVKTFAHSNGRDKIYVYKKQLDGKHKGKYLYEGTLEHGYATQEKSPSVLLRNVISAGTQDHFTHVRGKVIDTEDIKKYKAQ